MQIQLEHEKLGEDEEDDSGKTHGHRSYFYVHLEDLEIPLPTCLLQLSPPQTLNLFQCPKPLILDNTETLEANKFYFLVQRTVRGHLNHCFGFFSPNQY